MSGRKAEGVVEEVAVAGRGEVQDDFSGESATKPKRHGVSRSGTRRLLLLWTAPGWTQRAGEAERCQAGSLDGDQTRSGDMDRFRPGSPSLPRCFLEFFSVNEKKISRAIEDNNKLVRSSARGKCC